MYVLPPPPGGLILIATPRSQDVRAADARHTRRGARGGSRQASARADARSVQARSALRRSLPQHRLRALELRELADPTDRRADPVQGTDAHRAYRGRLEFSAATLG